MTPRRRFLVQLVVLIILVCIAIIFFVERQSRQMIWLDPTLEERGYVQEVEQP